jgi:hypothetical protein
MLCVMSVEGPSFFSIAALSASLAGLAGLVAALRRGEGLGSSDRYRLRQIVEFSFANILFAVAMVPLAALTGSVETAVRIGGGVAVAYLVFNIILLLRRQRRAGMPLHPAWVIPVALLNLATLLTASASLLVGAIGLYAALLVLLLARPMVAFTFVLASFESGPPAAQQ